MGILSFHKPDKIVLQKSNDFEGTFEFKPLEPGYGVTIGNALRRVLLNSLEGYAITSVKISGADHEFAIINGIIEDMTEIILNLKQVRIKRANPDQEIHTEKIFISVKGQDTLKAGDIEKFTTSFLVTNPDLVICTMDSSVKLDMTITIHKGRGYQQAEEQRYRELDLGTIAIDAIHTPIKNVSYYTENTRVEQKTDFEKLIMDIKTDGTIHPEFAIKEASKILIQHLMLITDDNITFDAQIDTHEEVIDEHVLHMRKLLKTPLEDLDLSVRAFNCLKAAKINCLADLVKFDTNELLKFRNFGRKSMVEIEAMVLEKGMHFGMDLAKFKLNED
jgi:DNA-directed RNA polymerase subunit alpha